MLRYRSAQGRKRLSGAGYTTRIDRSSGHRRSRTYIVRAFGRIGAKSRSRAATRALALQASADGVAAADPAARRNAWPLAVSGQAAGAPAPHSRCARCDAAMEFEATGVERQPAEVEQRCARSLRARRAAFSWTSVVAGVGQGSLPEVASAARGRASSWRCRRSSSSRPGPG